MSGPGVVPGAGSAAPAFDAVTLQPGMYMAVVSGAKVRVDFASTSAQAGDLEDGQVIEVLECRPNEAGQMRVRFDDGHGLGGWISATTKSSGRPVLRPIAGPLEPSRGMICVVKAEKAVVREGFAQDTLEAGHLGVGDVIETVDVRVNEKNQVRVAFELEDAEHLGWVSMVSATGDVLLEVAGDDYHLGLDADGDGVIDADEQARWDMQHAAADLDGDGQLSADELKRLARGARHDYAHGTVQQHNDGDDVYDD